jgi:hypothetical protein
MKIIEGTINDVHAKWKFRKKQEQEQLNHHVDVSFMNELNVSHVTTQRDDGILGFLDEEDI